MNLQNRQPDMPVVRERSASHGNGRNCFAAAVLLFGMIFFPAASAHAASEHAESRLSYLSMKAAHPFGPHYYGYADGVYFLVSKPFSHVKAELEKSLAIRPARKGFIRPALRGFKARDESGPLSHMKACWTDMAMSHHPELRAELNQQIKQKLAPAVTAALTAGIITTEEQTRLEQFLAKRWIYDVDTKHDVRFFSQLITRWSYYRRRATPVGYTPRRYNDDHIRIMDMSPLLGREPVTLVWFSSGWATTPRWHADTFYYQVPLVGGKTKAEKRSDRRPNGFMRFMVKMAKRMPVLSKEERWDAMRTYPVGTFSDEKAAPDPESVDLRSTPTIHVQGSYLPADEDHIRPDPVPDSDSDSDPSPIWQMLALPDGSVLASGLTSHRFVQRETGQHLRMNKKRSLVSRRVVQHGARVERLDAVPRLSAVNELKIDPAGTVWGYGVTGDGARFFKSWSQTPESGSTYQVCNPKRGSALPLELSADQISQTCDPRYPDDDWVVQPGQGIAFRSGAEIFALDKDGKWTHRTWGKTLRDAIWEGVGLERWTGLSPVRFGDGLFWRGESERWPVSWEYAGVYGGYGYGVDPGTARVAQTVRMSSFKDVFFGSLSTGWGLESSARSFDWYGHSIREESNPPHDFRIVDLTTGNPRLDVKTGDDLDVAIYSVTPYSVARSAHGWLLAISDGSSLGRAIVLDMKKGKPLATLQMPKHYMIDAMAFSWRGDKLWLYARKAGHSGRRKMIVWDIPAGLADAAQGTDMPDQLRFNFVKIPHECC